MRHSDQVRENVWYLFLERKMSKAEIARQTGIARNTIIAILKEPQPDIAHLCNIVKNSVEKQSQQLIEIIENDSKLPEIILKILNAVNDTELINDYAKNNGLKSLMTAFGVLSDKNISIKKLELERRKVEAIEKQLALKERELDLRMTSPEAFNGVTIINDVDAVREYRELAESDVVYTD